MQNDIGGLVLGKFNGRHSGTLPPGLVNHSPKFKNFTVFFVIFAFAVSSSNLSSLSVRTTVVVKTEGEVWIHQNSRFWMTICTNPFPPMPAPSLIILLSHLGRWEAVVVVEGVPLLLNLTLHSSCGLIFGRLGTTR